MSGREAAVVFGREAAEPATKSREVDLSRLKAFHLSSSGGYWINKTKDFSESLRIDSLSDK